MKKLSIVVIVGFPNVGKSTLFNRLLKEKKSLVHSLPGMTRDQVSALCSLKEKKFVLVDTGGFFDSQEDPLSSQIRDKAKEAAEKADILLFILDGKRDLLPPEEELYFSLKKLNKPIFVIVNKVDSLSDEDKLGDYYRLGEGRVFAISAEHKRNLEFLKSSLLEAIPSSVQEEKEPEPLKIAIVGRINVGKSSIVNRLCGEERLIVSEIPGTTRDSTDTLIFRNKKAFCLVDTAGIRKLSRTRDKREKASIIKAKKSIVRTDVICLIMDAQEFPTRQDSAIAHLSHESGKPLMLVLNKWDLIRKETETSEDFKEQVYTSGLKRVDTSRLNNFLSLINENRPPHSKNKRRMKIKYMTQMRVLPPTFVLFTHSRVSLAASYEKFFIHQLREKFDFWGTPVRLVLRKN